MFSVASFTLEVALAARSVDGTHIVCKKMKSFTKVFIGRMQNVLSPAKIHWGLSTNHVVYKIGGGQKMCGNFNSKKTSP